MHHVGVAHARVGGSEGAKPVLVLDKVRQVLEAFTGEAPQLTLAEIRRATGLPPTTCARLVQNLVAGGLLVRDGDRYRVGVTVLRWSAAALRALDLVPVVTPVIERLRDATGESAAVFVRQGAARTCVAVAPTRHRVIWQLHVGLSTPLHVGSGGRALLAFDDAAAAAVLAADRVSFTPNTITGARALRSALAETRRSGVAVSHEELDREVGGVSAPVFGPGGVVAALGVAGPAQRFGEADVARYVPAVLASASAASSLMGGEFPAAAVAASGPPGRRGHGGRR